MVARGPFVEVPVACCGLISWIFRENAENPGLTVRIFSRSWELVRTYKNVLDQLVNDGVHAE